MKSRGWEWMRSAACVCLVVLAFGFLPGAFERVALAPALAAPLVEAGIANDSQLTVTVTTEAAAALRFARVVVLAVRDGRAYESAHAVSDAEGRVMFGALPAGDTWVIANADGRARGSSHFVLEGARQLALPLPPENKVEVRVRDAEGRPIAGAEVEAAAAEPLTTRRATDAEGLARLDKLGAGPWRIEVRAAGYDIAHERAKAGDSLTVTLRRLGSILVRVVDLEGHAAQGARVQIAGASLWPAREGKTGEKGMVKLAGLYAGAYALRATHGTSASVTELSLPLSAGENVELELRLLPGRVVTARVVSANEGADPSPIAGARIVLAEGGVSAFPIEAVSDAKGLAVLGPIAAGGAYLSARAEGYVSREASSVPEPLAGEIVLALAKAGTLGGRVTDSRGFPIAGVTLIVVGTDFEGGPIYDDPRTRGFRDAAFDAALKAPASLIARGELGVVPGPVPPIPRGGDRALGSAPRAAYAVGLPWVTAKDGGFLLSPITPGRVRILARHPEYVETLSDVTTLPSGGSVSELSIVLRSGGVLEGQVRDATDQPVAGARVELIATRGSFSRQTHTATDGTFAFAAAPESCTVDVYLNDAAMQPSARAGARVPEGGRRELIVRLPSAREAMEVTVHDDRGAPLVAAQLTLMSLDPSEPLRQTAFTDAFGIARLAGAVGLAVRLEVRAAGHAPKSVSPSPAPAELSLTVEPAISVRGELRASGGRDPPRGTLVFYTELGPRTVVALADGSFSAQELGPGNARVVIRAPGFARIDKSVVLKQTAYGRPFDLGRFELVAEARVSGLVVSPRGEPVQGARVSEGHAPTFVAQGPTPAGVATTDARGRFELGELAGGAISLEAYAPDVGTGALAVQTVAGRTTPDVRLTLRGNASQAPELATTGGVAITLGERGGEPREVVVVAVATGSEAERASMVPGDTVVSVDGSKVATLEEARAKLSGPVERDVIVRLAQGGKERVVRVPRERVRR